MAELTDIEKKEVLESFRYMYNLHSEQLPMLEKLSEVYGEMLYISAMDKFRDHIVRYLNSLAECKASNEDLVYIYGRAVEELEELLDE
jgi:hypothetical protein